MDFPPGGEPGAHKRYVIVRCGAGLGGGGSSEARTPAEPVSYALACCKNSVGVTPQKRLKWRAKWL